MNLEEAKRLILAKADEIRDTIDKSGFCRPDCEACLRASAKGIIDEEYGINNSTEEIIKGAMGSFTIETITDQALYALRI